MPKEDKPTSLMELDEVNSKQENHAFWAQDRKHSLPYGGPFYLYNFSYLFCELLLKIDLK